MKYLLPHRFHQVVLLAALLLMPVSSTGAAATSNLNLSKSNINREFPGGKMVTATVSLTNPNETKIVYSTPASGDFILTQVCTSSVNGGIRLAVSGFGPIADISQPSCQSFTPGISLPSDAAITCSTTAYAAAGGSYFCTISGVRPPP